MDTEDEDTRERQGDAVRCGQKSEKRLESVMDGSSCMLWRLAMAIIVSMLHLSHEGIGHRGVG